ncbi:MAG: Gfo/Idh/MocA family oxidoreductase [Pseudomonadota bacterium]
MSRDLVVGIVGMGSIGRRHAGHLLDLGVRELVALRSGHGPSLPAELGGIREVRTPEAMLERSLDGVIVANPTALHASSALPYLERGVPVLVEKPLDAFVAAARPLAPFAEEILVAYCLRFHRVYRALREALERGDIGRPLVARFNRGYSLPRWHPDADYRREYAARRDQGGGVLRTLSHELDIAASLFGRFSEVTGVAERLSDLEIDVEDHALVLARTTGNVRVVLLLDYLSPDNVNRGEVLGTAGALRFDLVTNRLVRTDPQGATEVLMDVPELALDHVYRAQMEDFLGFLDGAPSGNAGYDDGLGVLRAVEAVEALGEERS